MRIAHVIYPTLTGLSYILFTLVYWSLGGRNEHGSRGIYAPALDWDNPVISIIWASIAVKGQKNQTKNLFDFYGNFLGIVLIHLLIWASTKLRETYYNNFKEDSKREALPNLVVM